jgi:hypothetical protein
MLTIDRKGFETLYAMLTRIRYGSTPTPAEIDEVFSANAFFVNFYSGWEGCSREVIRQVILHFDHPDRLPGGPLAAQMAEGFRLAVDQADLIPARLAILDEFDPSAVGERILGFLPAGTPLDSVVHITIDQINNAFVSQGEMGVSVLKGLADQKSFEEVISHELHHVCFRYWADQDEARQSILREHSGRSIAVMHVENLLMEGLANYYCTPGFVFRADPDAPPGDAYQSRLASLRHEEQQLFCKAEDILALSLEENTGYDACWEAYKAIAMDFEFYMLPAGHYLGARMIQIMDRLTSRDKILSGVQHLDEFLPLYNRAARQAGGFTFDPLLVEKFGSLFD